MSNPIEGLMSVAMENIKGMVDVKTIVGDAIQTPDGSTVVPISKVSYGFGAGGSEFCAKPMDKTDNTKMFGGGAGGGATINPIAFLVVNSEQIKLVPITNVSTPADKLIDMIPDMVNKVNKMIKSKSKKEVEETAIIEEE